MDRLNQLQRSLTMARIRAKNTQPELCVRKAAHAMGLRFRLHRRDLKGTPDLVFPKYKLVMFVHGCFWHRHAGCKRATLPQTRREFWETKLNGNSRRDYEAVSQLESEGWRVEIIWECETKDEAQLARKLADLFSEDLRRRKLYPTP